MVWYRIGEVYQRHVLKRSQMAGVAHHRPLSDNEFLAIALEQGAKPGRRSRCRNTTEGAHGP